MMAETKPSNAEIARVLDEIGGLLERQGADSFRIRAYQEGAQSIRQADRSIAELVRQDEMEQLRKLPGIGKGLAGVIREYVETGRSSQLDRLRGEVSPADVFTQVPGIGEELASRIAAQLDIQSLEELEEAAHDGRLEAVEGFGPERVKSVKSSLAGMLSRAAQRRSRQRVSQEEKPKGMPDIGTLLDVDAEYRRKSEAGELKKIAPKRFNPENEAWLPILHTERGEWNFTVLYSNTARAHELDKTHDWVVIYYDHDEQEDQVTVVTETRGSLEGKRVVRGYEAETRRFYQK